MLMFESLKAVIFFHEIKIYFVNIIKYVYNIYYIYYNYFNNKYLLINIMIIILKRAKKIEYLKFAVKRIKIIIFMKYKDCIYNIYINFWIINYKG